MSQAARRVALQLDYFLSAQFAGVAVAARAGLYKAAAIDLELLPTCPPGEEAKVVCDSFSREPSKTLWVGSMEQNTLLPAIAAGHKVTAVAAMFGRSPLCLAALPGTSLRAKATSESLRVGAHTDTVALLQRILPRAEVLDVDRANKLQLLRSGEVHAIQAYDVMETLKLTHALNEAPEVLHLEGFSPTEVSLGYSQVLFVPRPSLKDPAEQEVLRAFLRATFEGWGLAIRDPAAAAAVLLEVQGDNDHWVSSPEFVETSVRLCCDYVKRTMRCGKLGIIDPQTWTRASRWLGYAHEDSALDTSVWAVEEGQVDAHPVAARIHGETRRLSAEAATKHGRKPKLVVVTVGSDAVGPTHEDSSRRLQLFAAPDASWYSKKVTGDAVGVEVEEVVLGDSCTTEEVVQELKRHHDADGLQLLWPLHPGVDPEAAYTAIPWEKDVDGAHFMGRATLPGGRNLVDAFPPVTCDGVLQILDHHGVQIAGSRALIIGRSWLVGQPLAHLLGLRGATCTLAHSGSRDLGGLCSEADLIISAVGQPRLVKSHWVRPGTVVINVGTAFKDDTIVPDIAPFEELRHAKLVVRTVGPVSVAVLLHNVARRALTRATIPLGATSETPSVGRSAAVDLLQEEPLACWSLIQSSSNSSHPTLALSCEFGFPSFQAATDFIVAASKEAAKVGHHPDLQLTHQCTRGTTVTVKLATIVTGGLTRFDFDLAARLGRLYPKWPKSRGDAESAFKAERVSAQF